MYNVTVRDHFMIAHSFRGTTFGPRNSCTVPPMWWMRRSSDPSSTQMASSWTWGWRPSASARSSQT